MNGDVSTGNETLIDMTHDIVHAFLAQLYPIKNEMEIRQASTNSQREENLTY